MREKEMVKNTLPEGGFLEDDMSSQNLVFGTKPPQEPMFGQESAELGINPFADCVTDGLKILEYECEEPDLTNEEREEMKKRAARCREAYLRKKAEEDMLSDEEDTAEICDFLHRVRWAEERGKLSPELKALIEERVEEEQYKQRRNLFDLSTKFAYVGLFSLAALLWNGLEEFCTSFHWIMNFQEFSIHLSNAIGIIAAEWSHPSVSQIILLLVVLYACKECNTMFRYVD